MIFKVDIVWGQALARAEKFHSMCTQTAHTPIFVNFDENGRNFWEKNTPKMCLLGAHTDTPFWGPKPPPIPQNISKFHALTIICRKDTACGKNVTEIGTTFFKCMYPDSWIWKSWYQKSRMWKVEFLKSRMWISKSRMCGHMPHCLSEALTHTQKLI